MESVRIDTVIEQVTTEQIQDCPICMDETDKEWLRLACSHSYHKECIYRWLGEHTTCPVCRYQVVMVPPIEHLPTLSVEQRSVTPQECLRVGLFFVGAIVLSAFAIGLTTLMFKTA
jgi:Ring finger domain